MFVEAWRSGQVTRKHTMENIRAENVAEHSWGVVLLLLLAWPHAPAHLIIGAQIHDFGERATGDMPGPVKWGNPILEKEMERLEREHTTNLLPESLCDDFNTLTEAEWAVIEIFDRAEFCISMIREKMLGNRYTELYYKRAWDKMTQVLEKNKPAFWSMSQELWAGIIALRRDIAEHWNGMKESKPQITNHPENAR